MKRRNWKWGGMLLIVAAVLLYNWYYVDGDEIGLVEEADETCQVIITKYDRNNGDTPAAADYLLTGEQVVKLKEFLLEQTFTRGLSGQVRVDNEDEYSIAIRFTHNEEFIHLRSFGNKVFYVYYPQDLQLRIRDGEAWKATMEALIEGAELLSEGWKVRGSD